MLRSQVGANIAYALGRVASSAGLLILMPFLVNQLTAVEYGVWVMLEIAVLLGVMVVLLGMDVGLMRIYWLLESELERRRLTGTILLWVAIWGLGLVVFAAGLGTDTFSRALGGAPSAWVWAGATAWAEGLLAVLLAAYRIREKAIAFAILSTARTLLFMALTIWLVSQGYGVAGGLAGRFAATALFVAIAMVIALREGWVGIPGYWKGLVRAARYSLPLLPANLASYVLFAGDRYFLGKLAGLAVVGVYSFAYKIGTSLDALIVRPFAADWAPRRFRIAAEPNPNQHYAQALALYLYPAVGFSLLVWAATPLIYDWFAPDVYGMGRAVVPIILVAVLVFGLSYPLNIGIMLMGKTEHIAIITAAAAGICVLLYVCLIPRYGMFGAAWATLVGYSFYTLLVFLGSLRLYPIRYPLRPLGGAFFLFIAGAIQLQIAGEVVSGMSPLATTAINLALVAGLLGVVAFFYRSQARSLARLMRGGDGNKTKG
jgi:O-antigen/teichoic acid export membrane protein